MKLTLLDQGAGSGRGGSASTGANKGSGENITEQDVFVLAQMEQANAKKMIPFCVLSRADAACAAKPGRNQIPVKLLKAKPDPGVISFLQSEADASSRRRVTELVRSLCVSW